MSTSRSENTTPHAPGPQPVWEIATLYPPQGMWTEVGYLALTNSISRLIEFTDGKVEFLPMPTKSHQVLLMALLDALRVFVQRDNKGMALPAPLRVRIRPDKFREPDIVFMSSANLHRAGDDYFEGADLVMEIVSSDPESRKRDLEEKPRDYAEALIPEYWIVDPQERCIHISSEPSESGYATTNHMLEDDVATSVVQPGFSIRWNELL